MFQAASNWPRMDYFRDDMAVPGRCLVMFHTQQRKDISRLALLVRRYDVRM